MGYNILDCLYIAYRISQQLLLLMARCWCCVLRAAGTGCSFALVVSDERVMMSLCCN
jgi:hypothetical protein